eukprot:5370179-Prymnesium_polylepis.1
MRGARERRARERWAGQRDERREGREGREGGAAHCAGAEPAEAEPGPARASQGLRAAPLAPWALSRRDCTSSAGGGSGGMREREHTLGGAAPRGREAGACGHEGGFAADSPRRVFVVVALWAACGQT